MHSKSYQWWILAPALGYVTVLFLVAAFVVKPPALGWIGFGVSATIGIAIAFIAAVLFPHTRANAVRLHPRLGGPFKPARRRRRPLCERRPVQRDERDARRPRRRRARRRTGAHDTPALRRGGRGAGTGGCTRPPVRNTVRADEARDRGARRRRRRRPAAGHGRRAGGVPGERDPARLAAERKEVWLEQGWPSRCATSSACTSRV